MARVVFKGNGRQQKARAGLFNDKPPGKRVAVLRTGQNSPITIAHTNAKAAHTATAFSRSTASMGELPRSGVTNVAKER